jgi:hypothetical protein
MFIVDLGEPAGRNASERFKSRFFKPDNGMELTKPPQRGGSSEAGALQLCAARRLKQNAYMTWCATWR